MPVTIVGNNTPTAGGVVYGDGTNYASTSAGTSGQILQSNGASAPSWVAAPSSAMTFITSTTATGSPSTVDIENAMTGYQVYLLTGENITLSSGASIYMRMKLGGSYSTTNYYYHISNNDSSTTTYQANAATGATFIDVISSIQGAASDSIGIAVWIFNPSSTATAKSVIVSAFSGRPTPVTKIIHSNYGAAGNTSTSALTGIRFLQSGAATFSSGTFRLYGIANS